MISESVLLLSRRRPSGVKRSAATGRSPESRISPRCRSDRTSHSRMPPSPVPTASDFPVGSKTISRRFAAGSRSLRAFPSDSDQIRTCRSSSTAARFFPSGLSAMATPVTSGSRSFRGSPAAAYTAAVASSVGFVRYAWTASSDARSGEESIRPADWAASCLDRAISSASTAVCRCHTAIPAARSAVARATARKLFRRRSLLCLACWWSRLARRKAAVSRGSRRAAACSSPSLSTDPLRSSSGDRWCAVQRARCSSARRSQSWKRWSCRTHSRSSPQSRISAS